LGGAFLAKSFEIALPAEKRAMSTSSRLVPSIASMRTSRF
jgi:hypothetical protein